MVQVMNTKEYMKINKISFYKLSKILAIDIAYIYRVINFKGNSATKVCRPSERFMAKLKMYFPELHDIFEKEINERSSH
jgi:hypothetical protein